MAPTHVRRASLPAHSITEPTTVLKHHSREARHRLSPPLSTAASCSQARLRCCVGHSILHPACTPHPCNSFKKCSRWSCTCTSNCRVVVFPTLAQLSMQTVPHSIRAVASPANSSKAVKVPCTFSNAPTTAQHYACKTTVLKTRAQGKKTTVHPQ